MYGLQAGPLWNRDSTPDKGTDFSLLHRIQFGSVAHATVLTN